MGRLFSGISKVKHQYDDFRREGEAGLAGGSALEGNAVNGLDDLADEYRGYIKEGGLPPAVERAFGIQQGAISDQVARARGAFGAELNQRAAASGGRFDPNAALAYEVDNNANLNQDEFQARNDLAVTQANMRLQNTNEYLDRIAGIQKEKGALAESDLSRSASMWLSGISGKADWMLGLAKMATGMLGGAASGAKGGG